MGVPLLFTDPGGGTPDLIVVPFPGLYPSEELFPGQDIFPDEGPTLDFYGADATVGSFGTSVSVDPAGVTFDGGVATIVGADEQTVVVTPTAVTFTGAPTIVATPPV